MSDYRERKIFVLHNSTGCRLWRIYPQLNYARKEGVQSLIVNGADPQPWYKIKEKVDWADTVLFQSTFDERTVDTALANGKQVVFEYDDLLHEVPDNHPMKGKMTEAFQEGIKTMLQKATKCVTTNDLLKKEYEHLNKNIHLFPNYMDVDDWNGIKELSKMKSRTIRLGWAGGLAHMDDLEFIKPVIKKILDKYPNVKFVYCGGGGSWSDDPMQTFNYGKDLFSDISPERREYSLGTSPECWPSKLRSLRFDIGLAPLVRNKFAERKTPIKWMEYGINKAPTVGQDFMYSQVIEDGVNGFVADTEDEYFAKISQLIEDEELRQRMGQQAHDDIISKHNFKDHGGDWLDIIFK